MFNKIARKFIHKLKVYNIKKNGTVIGYKSSIGFNSQVLRSKFGDYSGCNSNCIINDTRIENFVNIAWNVCIGPRSHIHTNFTTHDFIYTNNEQNYTRNELPFDRYFNVIGSDVWIGCNSIILPGIEIGNGAIIAAGSIVTKSVPPYAIVGGNPAKIIRYRFEENIINELERIKWFDWDIERIINNREYLESIVGFKHNNFNKNYFSKKEVLKE
jgi:acetyltransferase-like isoleucine patch superfamily enzyme